MSAQTEQRLIEIISPLIAPLGYEVVHVEIQTHRQKVLRLFIDFTEPGTEMEKGPCIGIEDCVKVTRALDEPLDQCAEVEGIFRGAYELEVSSPGVERPLRQRKDFERFTGRKARLHTFRALSEDEIGNAAYFSRNPKQKNFSGVLKGLNGDRVLLSIGDAAMEITIPFALISKANLDSGT